MTVFSIYVPLTSTSPKPVRTEIRPGAWLDSRLALWLEAPRMLVMADLHWGYSASHRARGNLVPWWGDEQIEQRLESLVTDYRPAEMIWLGDVVHAAEGSARVDAYLRQAPVTVTVLAGNHDRRWAAATARSLTRGRYFFHHGDGTPAVPADCIEVVGHHHPAIGWHDAAGTRLKLPALVVTATRWILPAFSPWAEGTPWNDRATSADTVWAVAPSRIFPFTRPAHRTAAPAV